MALRTQSRTATTTALAMLAAGGLAGCHRATPQRSATSPPPAVSGRPRRSPSPAHGGERRQPAPKPSRRSPALSTGPSHLSRRDTTGLPPVISRVPVKDKVVFITIDDGWEKDADFVDLIRTRRIPVTLFLEEQAIQGDYGYFRALQRAGALIEDHTVTHPYLPKLSYARQRREICRPAGTYARQFGRRPTLFRAPYGAASRDTLRAARDCGMRAVFFWREVVTGGRIAYQEPGKLHRGDILLVHFDPHLTAGIKRLLRTIRKQGFRPAAVREHLPARYFAPR